MSIQAPERLGPYRLVRKIGEGGMGVVHLGLDGEGQEVAIKVLHPHVAADLKARDRLTREVETMRRVRSPFVAEVLDAELVGGQPYVVTRFAPGRTLEDTVLAEGPLAAREVIGLAQGLCQALVAIQAADVHALASTVFFAATGTPPFGTGTFESVCFNIMEGRAQLDKAPVWLRGWLNRALQVEPSVRPGAQELLRLARALDPSVTTFNEGPTGTKRLGDRTRTMETFSDLLPPVEYGQAAPPPAPPQPRNPTRREERPPPYVPAPMHDRPVPHSDQRVAGPPPPDRRVVPAPTSPAPARPYTPPPYTPPSERKRYLFGSQVVGLLLLVTLVALTVMMPVMAGAVAVALALVLRIGEYLFGDLVKRRQMRGSSAADPLLALLGTPWALVKSALVTAVHVPLALLFGICVWGVLYWAGQMGVNEAAAYAAGAFAAGLFVLPGGGAPRKTVTRTLTGVLRSPGAALVAVVLVGTAALFSVMFALGQDPTWAPWRAPESVINDLASDAKQSTIGLITGLIGSLLDGLGLGWLDRLNPWS
ncbi:serine/threonine protein kinase [Nonomuraea sp. MG754425]|uniref:serine/threonine-protein kinase n=1 Tax=Nonomuraea sp. MG754425 TaxID=2570319 RepID=UPI001F01293A|nr:protein kinase [Nonomuraea sp. MG754425]MCF6469188.1 serine/threonine protein kinase [Nonomuraea sp. MG754425]